MTQVRAISQSATTREELNTWTLMLGGERSAAPDHIVEALTSGIPVSVPGSVLGALIEAGLAVDVTAGGAEEEVAWASQCSWLYRTTVPDHGDGAAVQVTFEGIDTLATVRVDGEPVLDADDMFHRWTIDLDSGRGQRNWEIEVELHEVLSVIAAREAAHPLPRADMYDIPFNQVRKMACSFGWDWGPATVTSGLWRAVTVTRMPQARIASTHLNAHWREGAVLDAVVRIDGEADHVQVTVRSHDPGAPVVLETRIPVIAGQAVMSEQVLDADQWHVIHRGEQPLYDVVVSVRSASAFELDSLTRRVGFRRIDLVQEVDKLGRSFEIHVNDERVWVRGFNWIPADTLPERVTPTQVRSLIADVVATGANMLRVWGGGVVESDEFYAACDEAGVLVWQDFSFACAAYAEDAAQVSRVRREVADAVQRVGFHASLALWCGCNENLWGHEDWGWKESLGEAGAWGQHLYYDVIPAALSDALDAHPYIPGSPFSYDRDVHPNDPSQGLTHHWDTWNELDYAAFEDKDSRFAAEFGWQAPATWPTLCSALGDEPSGAADPRLARLQKHPLGSSSLARGIADHVPHLPTDGRGWYFAAQLVQARALKASIGHFRSMHDTCSGALWWQFNDCWPALSWSVVDITGAKKLAWYAAAEVMAPRALVAAAKGAPDALTLVNDCPQSWVGAARVRAVTVRGETLLDETVRCDVAPHGFQAIKPTRIPAGAVGVVVDVSGLRTVRWLLRDTDLDHPDSHVDVVRVEAFSKAAPGETTLAASAGRDIGGNAPAVRITVRARTLVRDLSLLVETHRDVAHCIVDRQMITLLPGEEATFTVQGGGADISRIDWAALLAAASPLCAYP